MAKYVSDIRALPTLTLNLYLYPLGGWGIALLGLYLTERSLLALGLLAPLALWQAGLTLVWGIRLARRVDRGELRPEEAQAGVQSVGHILAASALAPAIVFITEDPLAASSWSTVLGVAVVSGVAWVGVNTLLRLAWRAAHAAALTLAVLALPVSSTGAVTVATMLGLYEKVIQNTPIPDMLDLVF